MRGVRVGRSAISGCGLFATRPFRKGQVICEYTGKVIKADADTNNKYLFELSTKWTLDGSPKSNIGRWANHACGGAGNASADVSQRLRVWLYARRRILPGEEIFYDYGKEYSEWYLCRCRCIGCRPRQRNRLVASKRNGKANGHERRDRR